MIEINLLPEELKQTKTKIALPVGQLLYLLAAGLGLLIILHLFFALVILGKNFQYRTLNKQWLNKGSALEKVEAWRKQYNLGVQDTQDVIKLIQQRIIFAEKLKVMSELLPEGIWFNDLSIKQKDFRLEGSVVSLKSEHMSLLRQFLEQLKSNKNFSADFTRLELGSTKMREFSGYQLMDFSLEGNLR